MTDRDPIEHLLTRIDRPVTPSADFTRDLRDRLLAELDPNQDAEGERPTMSAISSMPLTGQTHVPPVPLRRPAGRWMPRLEAAAAILLLFGLFAALGGSDQVRDRFAGLISRNNRSTSGPLGPASMYGGDAGRTGLQPGPEPQYEFVDSWTLGVDGTYDSGFAPVALGDTVYRTVVTSSDPNGASTTTLQAIDVVTGTVRWQQAIEVWGSPAVTTDFVFVNVLMDGDASGPDSWLIALDARTGAEVWRVNTGPVAGWIGDMSPIVLDDLVYTAVPNGTVYAVDGRTGEVRWTSTEATSSEPGAESRSGRPPIANSGQLAAGDGALYVVNTGGHVVALDAATGKSRWDIDVRGRFGIFPERIDPAVVDGVVVLKIRGTDESPGASTGGTTVDVVATVETSTGQDLWRRTLDSLSAELAFAGGRVIVPLYGTDVGSVLAIDLQTATDAWTLSGTDPNPGGVSIAGATIFLTGGDGKLRAIDAASGQARWHIPTGTKIEFAAVVTQEHLIVQGADGTMLSYSTDMAATPPTGSAPNKATPEPIVENATAVATQPSPTPVP
jgi:outer membrane protein assembly factor BamB